MNPRITLSQDTVGHTDDSDDPVVVSPGTYEVVDLTFGDEEFAIEVGDDCILIPVEGLGLVECLVCKGDGRYYYRDGYEPDDISWDHCEDCARLGGVPPEVSERQWKDYYDQLHGEW